MSNGQFELKLINVEDAGEGKNKGLDLEVYSIVTGKTRSVNTLSGGESFMAALSLALGMADQIQAATAAIHLDVMFIDEGFGSLSDNARNEAVNILKEMAGKQRQIGIISHVSELKDEIENQLIVKRTTAAATFLGDNERIGHPWRRKAADAPTLLTDKRQMMDGKGSPKSDERWTAKSGIFVRLSKKS